MLLKYKYVLNALLSVLSILLLLLNAFFATLQWETHRYVDMVISLVCFVFLGYVLQLNVKKFLQYRRSVAMLTGEEEVEVLINVTMRSDKGHVIELGEFIFKDLGSQWECDARILEIERGLITELLRAATSSCSRGKDACDCPHCTERRARENTINR